MTKVTKLGTAVLLAVALLAGLVPAAEAAAQPQLRIDGSRYHDGGGSVVRITPDGRALVPIQVLAQVATGDSTAWGWSISGGIGTSGAHWGMAALIGSPVGWVVRGELVEEIDMGTPAQMCADGIAWIPVRAIAEALGGTVRWHPGWGIDIRLPAGISADRPEPWPGIA